MSHEPWYGVRSVIEHPDEDPTSGEHWYEERITLWRAGSIEEALELADAEADHYAEENDCENTGLVQAFRIASPHVTSGTEVFSLIRGSRLAADDYLDALFDTGNEIQREAADDRD
jgi:hypothetical protein